MEQTQIQSRQSGSFLERLQWIDRRILYLILLLFVSIPILKPITVPNEPLPMSVSLWQSLDATPPNKIVLLSSQWDQGTRGENGSQAEAIIRHMMRKRIRFATLSFVASPAQVIKRLVDQIAPEYGYVYGRDWFDLGLQPSPNNFIKGLNSNLISDRKDTVQKVGIGTLPMMNGIKSIDDVYMVVEITASATQGYWIQFLSKNVKFSFCCTSVMAPEAVPYYQTGQMQGLLWGVKGAYDYEQMNVKKLPGEKFGRARQTIGPLSAAVLLVILSILVGNLAMLASKRAVRGQA